MFDVLMFGTQWLFTDRNELVFWISSLDKEKA